MANGVTRIVIGKNAIEKGSYEELARDQIDGNDVAIRYKEFPAKDIKNKHKGNHLN